MFEVRATDHLTKSELYSELCRQAAALLEGETDRIANAANLSALLYQILPDCNWLGFYFHRNGELIVGPFQGKPACVHIPIGKGVCGTAAERRETVIVKDVHQFPGHIACDAASRSEIVVPLIHDGELIGVLDVDSPTPSRFDDVDKQGLQEVARIFLNGLGGSHDKS